MCKEFKDGLKEEILVKVKNESKFNVYFQNMFSSIDELLKMYYKLYKNYSTEFEKITYRGIKLKIVYDVVLDNQGEIIEETDFITIRKDLKEQIESINEELDGK